MTDQQRTDEARRLMAEALSKIEALNVAVYRRFGQHQRARLSNAYALELEYETEE